MLPRAAWLAAVALAAATAETPPANERVHAFFYLWYGNPESDGKYRHWNHEVLPHWNARIREQHVYGVSFPACDEIHSPYFPARGCYSSRHRATLVGQFNEMLEAGIGVAVVSWWGQASKAASTDTQGVSTDAAIPMVLDAAGEVGIKVAFHLEPYSGRSAASVRDDVRYIHDNYGSHDALLRWMPRRQRNSPPFRSKPSPVFYVYDSYHIPSQAWFELLSPDAPRPIRGHPTDGDGFFFGLWLDAPNGRGFAGIFDGFYSYFAADGFSYGSTTRNWATMAAFAEEHDLLFVPSVAPGYDDRRIRPWNVRSFRSREGGAYFDRLWDAAVQAGARVVSITSYNEWGEGTQIEPAVPYTVPEGLGLPPDVREKLRISTKSEDYSPRKPTYYLDATRKWASILADAAAKAAKPSPASLRSEL